MARTASQNGRRSRMKGAAFERDVARLLLPLFPGAERCLAQTRTAKRGGCDVEGTPYWLELTCGADADSRAEAKWAQACADTDGRPVVVVVRPDRRQPWVLMLAATLGATHLPEPAPRVRMALDDWLRVLMARRGASAPSATTVTGGAT
jgi:hypothetical protein